MHWTPWTRQPNLKCYAQKKFPWRFWHCFPTISPKEQQTQHATAEFKHLYGILMGRNRCKSLGEMQFSPNMPKSLFQSKFTAEQWWVSFSKLEQHITNILGDKEVRDLRFCNISLVFILFRKAIQTKDLAFGELWISTRAYPKGNFISRFNEELTIRFAGKDSRRIKRPNSFTLLHGKKD